MDSWQWNFILKGSSLELIHIITVDFNLFLFLTWYFGHGLQIPYRSEQVLANIYAFYVRHFLTINFVIYRKEFYGIITDQHLMFLL